MGGIVNPIGNRLSQYNFWSHTNPISYHSPFGSTELGGSIRLLFNCWTRVLCKLHSKYSRYQTNVMLIEVVSNLWGFCGDRLTVFLSLYDYRLAERAVGTIPHRWFFKKFLRFMYQHSFKNRALSVINKQSIFESPYLTRRNRVRSVVWRVRRYVRKYFKYVRTVVGRRIANWHRLLIIFTKPYLFRLASLYGLRRVYVMANLKRSSFTAGLVARYVVIRLKQNTSLNYLIKQLRWGMLEMGFGRALGYKVCFSGRFSRKQIASYRWARIGLAGINRLNSAVDYAYDYGFTRFGAYGFKIWIYYEGG